jgi:hypothetical protein
MRPALAALAAQQKIIDHHSAQINAMGRGLNALARMAGVEQRVAAAMLRREADIQNPAQAVPEPPAGPPAQSTVDAKTPEAFGDVRAPGLVPGTTNDVAADATTTAYTPGMDIGSPAIHQLDDVTQPVDGTQGPRPLEETKTLTDVRVGDPMRPDVAFPLQNGFANAQRTSAKQEPPAEDRSARTMASIRLARLQIAAGIATGNDLGVAAKLDGNTALSTTAIEQEIKTLEQVRTAASRRRPPSARPPRMATPQRGMPSMQGAGEHTATRKTATTDDLETADAELFL